MSVQLRKYAALFLLLVFVFPFVEKGIHDVAHSKDTHCHTTNTKHFHSAEHHCSICDFTVSGSTASEYFPEITTNINCTTVLFNFYTENFTVSPSFSFLLRGPPIA